MNDVGSSAWNASGLVESYSCIYIRTSIFSLGFIHEGFRLSCVEC